MPRRGRSRATASCPVPRAAPPLRWSGVHAPIVACSWSSRCDLTGEPLCAGAYSGASEEDAMARQIKVACLLGDGFEDTEFRAPYERMRREGFDVVVIGARKGAELRGKRGKETVRADAGIDEVDPADFDLLFIPGGNSPDQLRADPRFVEFVKRFDQEGKPIAAICHGPQLLMSARRVKGRMLTAWKT